MKLLRRLALAFLILFLIAVAITWHIGGIYALNVMFRHGGTIWLPVSTRSQRLSPSMRLALDSTSPSPTSGTLQWQEVSPGFQAGELPVLVNHSEVDRILLARVDPARFRFEVRNEPAGDFDLDAWMSHIKPALVVNGAYFSHHGTPDCPFISNGTPLGPQEYDAKAGAFVVSGTFTGIRDLSQVDWKTAFEGARNGMVSYPLLLQNGQPHVQKISQWLANRSFVAQDDAGYILIGTTQDAYFSLDRLAHFLQAAPLHLTYALNLDGGPVACQGISLNGFERRQRGRWELQVENDHGKLLAWPYGAMEMPIVLAVFPK